MPQMMPINWIFFFFFFIFFFLLFNIMNYYIYYNFSPKSSLKMNFKKVHPNWKW